MNQETWTAVDRYLTDLLGPSDPVLDAALADSATAGLPAINVSPTQGRLLQLLARVQGARNILRSGPWAATARSGWPRHCHPADG